MPRADLALRDTPTAWLRLCVTLALGTLGGVGLWSIAVALPSVQAEFGVPRAAAALPYTLAMLGFGIGTMVMGRLADRFGVMAITLFAAVSLGAFYALVAQADSLAEFALLYGLIGLCGSSAVFSPLVADASLWFVRHRGIAVAIAASGNYLAGAIWPPLIERLIAAHGWRTAHLVIGAVCLCAMLPLALLMRRRAPVEATGALATPPRLSLPGVPAGRVQGLVMLAGVSCCIAMAMPQVHIVAYCADLGYGAARGAEMLALMLFTGLLSRLGFGLVMDRIGAPATLLLGSLLQASALALFLPFDGLVPLYIISGLFGLFQGGIVPSYAVIIRDLFPPAEAGTRVGLVLASTVAGMAVGGWMTGAIFDATGSYQAAIINGLAWNGANAVIVGWLFLRLQRRAVAVPA
jgi:MFS family permease